MGDSVTEHLVAVSDAMETQIEDLPPVGTRARVDRHENRGWVSLLVARITIRFPDLELRFRNAGRGGDTSRLLLQRLGTDVLVHRPSWCLLSAGLVDVRRSFQPERAQEAVSVDEYRSNLRTMARLLMDTGARVVMLEPTPHSRPPMGAPSNVQVQAVNRLTMAYGSATAEIAAECGAGLVRLFRPIHDIEARLKGRNSRATLFADEVHLNMLGDLIYSQLVFDFLAAEWGFTTP